MLAAQREGFIEPHAALASLNQELYQAATKPILLFVTPMTDPQISAIIPDYNHAQFLPRSVGSFLNQPLLLLEIIVIDDARPTTA